MHVIIPKKPGFEYMHLESVSKIDTYTSDIFSYQCVEFHYYAIYITHFTVLSSIHGPKLHSMLTKWEVHCKLLTHHTINMVVEL